MAPAYPHRPKHIMDKLHNALESAECRPGFKLTQLHFGHICGLSKSTINDWLCTDHAGRFGGFVCALERLSEGQRLLLFRRICRRCPRLSDPALSHDRESVRQLESLLRCPRGVTLVVGGSEKARTFLITAMGNSAYAINPKRSTCGLDLQTSASFSPVPGVIYCAGIVNPNGGLQQTVVQAWPFISAAFKGPLVLLNGVWFRVPELRPQILRLGENKHLLLADNFDSSAVEQVRRSGLPVNVVKVSAHEKRASALRITIEDLRDEAVRPKA